MFHTIWFWPATWEPYFSRGVPGSGPVVGGSMLMDGSASPFTVNTISSPVPLTYPSSEKNPLPSEGN